MSTPDASSVDSPKNSDPTHTSDFSKDQSELYFRQLLVGRDIAPHDPLAQQMVNFVYLVGDRSSGEAIVIDPAYDISGIMDILAQDNMRLTGALATHYHPDHIGGSMMGMNIAGITELLTHTSIPIHVQTDEIPWIQKVTDVTTSDLVGHISSDKVMVGNIPIELIHTPGHTPGSQCFYVADRLIAGDTLFLQGCGRTDLPGGDPAMLYESLTQKLQKVPDSAILYPGHLYSPEACASLGVTRQTNMVFGPRSQQEWLQHFGNG